VFLVDIKKLLTHSLTHSKSYYHSCWLNFSLRFLCSQNGECCPVLPCHAPSVPCVRWNDVIRGVYSIEAWTQPASLKKTRGNENHAYFRENWGEEKLTGEERLNYLSTYLHCLLIFSKIFLLAPLARLHFIFIPNQGTRNIVLYMAGTVKSISLLKVGQKGVDFPSHCWWPDVTKLITHNLN